MGKIDIKRERKALYAAPPDRFAFVDVPPLDFLMIDGAGDPNVSPDYAAAVEALYSAAYTLKFMVKREDAIDYVVPPLEGLWWADDPASFLTRDKAAWHWRMMICVPVGVTPATAGRAIAQAATRKPDLPIDRLRFETWMEGRSVQILHIGPYDQEGPVLEQLHRVFLPDEGLTFAGHHHEIYLSDPRRTASEKLRTILRQPVRPAG